MPEGRAPEGRKHIARDERSESLGKVGIKKSPDRGESLVSIIFSIAISGLLSL